MTQFIHGFQELKYMHGHGNHFQSEALPDALPKGQNSPQKCPYGLYAEQLSGSAFTAPRACNVRSWLYRQQPSVKHSGFQKVQSNIIASFFQNKDLQFSPQQIRLKPIPEPEDKDWLDSLLTLAGAGDPSIKNGLSIYSYSTKRSMDRHSFYNSDGDMLIVPQRGTLFIKTQFGKLTVGQRQIAIVPRGIYFSVAVNSDCRGWVAQIFKGHLKIPDLGPIGSNGLANPRDFQVPVASFDLDDQPWIITNKYIGGLYRCKKQGSPYNVIAWHGNYYPYKYNLDLFNTVNTVSFDHPDPSIFTVLTCQTDQPGTALLDFVIFPPRWMVAQHTFRPPYYHRNCMSQFMGNIQGAYDAKQKGFAQGQSSLHSIMSAHGPDKTGFTKGSESELVPVRYPYENLAFMFESCMMLKTTKQAIQKIGVDSQYRKCWQSLQKIKLM